MNFVYICKAKVGIAATLQSLPESSYKISYSGTYHLITLFLRRGFIERKGRVHYAKHPSNQVSKIKILPHQLIFENFLSNFCSEFLKYSFCIQYY